MNSKQHIIHIILIILLGLSIFSINAKRVYASTSDQGLGCGEGFPQIVKWLCDVVYTEADPVKQKELVGAKLNTVFSFIIGFLTTVAGLWFIFQFIIAGYQWINSAGDKTALEAARNKIYNALIGIIIIASAWVIIGILSTIFGWKILNPGEIIQTLGL